MYFKDRIKYFNTSNYTDTIATNIITISTAFIMFILCMYWYIFIPVYIYWLSNIEILYMVNDIKKHLKTPKSESKIKIDER